jgi:leader peptidase (prepilin peptidase) / N-methyltransferase
MAGGNGVFALAIGLLFAVWHSFADALAWRIYTAYYSPRRKTISGKVSFIFHHSSHCEFCSSNLPWYGMIPVAGFFILKRKCHNCTRPLSWRFPVFETGAFLFGFALGFSDMHPAHFAVALLAWLLLWIVITVDYRVLLIPTEAILGLLVLGLFSMLVLRHPGWHTGDEKMYALGLDMAVAFCWYFFFHLLRILSGYKMGLADVRLVLALGFLLGHPFAIYLPGFAAALAIVFYLLRRRSILIYAPSSTQIPFGVFLGAGYLFLYLARCLAA